MGLLEGLKCIKRWKTNKQMKCSNCDRNLQPGFKVCPFCGTHIESQHKNYYEILGLSKTATRTDISKAFRNLALKYHPDHNNNVGAEGEFKLIYEAYEILYDTNKRSEYDSFLRSDGYKTSESKSGRFQQFMTRGKEAYESKNYRSALDYFNQAIAINDSFSESYSRRAAVFQKLGENSRVISDCNKAISLDALNAQAYLERGSIIIGLGKYQEAIEDLSKAIRLDPYEIVALQNRAFVYATIGDEVSSLKDFDMAIRINPKLADLYVGRGSVHILYRRFVKGFADLDYAIELAPNEAKSYFKRGDAHRLQRNFKKALVDLDKAINLNPKVGEYFYSRGLVNQALKPFYKRTSEQAAMDFQRAKDLDPKVGEYFGHKLD